MKRHRSRHSSHRSSSPSRGKAPTTTDLDPNGKRPRRSHDDEPTERLKLPFDLKCKGCNCIVAKGVTIEAIKKIVASNPKEIWNLTVECRYCEHKTVVERISQDPVYKVIGEDEELDVEAWKEKRSREIFDKINPSLSDRRNFFDMYHIGGRKAAKNKRPWNPPFVKEEYRVILP